MLNLLSMQQAFHEITLGAVGVLPTDTVYGLVCAADNEVAVRRLYALKSRENKPGTILAADIDQLVNLGIPRRYLQPVAHYWPNPISVVVPITQGLAYLHQGKYSLAVRIPNDQKLQKLLKESGPLLTSSANLPAMPPAENIDQAYEYFAGRLDFYVDGGLQTAGQASTIIRVVDDAVEVLREGAIRLDESGQILPKSDSSH